MLCIPRKNQNKCKHYKSKKVVSCHVNCASRQGKLSDLHISILNVNVNVNVNVMYTQPTSLFPKHNSTQSHCFFCCCL